MWVPDSWPTSSTAFGFRLGDDLGSMLMTRILLFSELTPIPYLAEYYVVFRLVVGVRLYCLQEMDIIGDPQVAKRPSSDGHWSVKCKQSLLHDSL